MTRIPNVSIIQNTTRALPCAYVASFYSLRCPRPLPPQPPPRRPRPTPLLLFPHRSHGRAAPPPTGRVVGAPSSTFTGVKRRTHKSRPPHSPRTSPQPTIHPFLTIYSSTHPPPGYRSSLSNDTRDWPPLSRYVSLCPLHPPVVMDRPYKCYSIGMIRFTDQ